MNQALATEIRFLHLHADDNVVVLAQDARAGNVVKIQGDVVTVQADLTMGHKLAFRAIPKGAEVLKYGAPIGLAATDIQPGEHVHLHNLNSQYTVIEDMEAGQT
jgi:hypothetical protein